MKIALAQINPTVGDVDGNVGQIRRDIHAAADSGADLVVFPELAIIGYPPKDLLLSRSVIDDCVAAVDRLAHECRGVAAIIGYPCPSDIREGRALHNAAALCVDGRVTARHVKSLLPTYDVFDEHRYFEPAPDVRVSELGRHRIGVSICEDLWNDQSVLTRPFYHDNPIDELAEQGADLLINCSASPFVVGKQDVRLKLMGSTAKRLGLALFYCNQVGGNDELIFDGNSCAYDSGGSLIAHAKDFEPDLLLVDLEPGAAGRIEAPKGGIESVYHALVLGLRDYCRKCGFQSAVVGLSGGIDSAVTCAVAAAALGPGNVRGISMPSRFSSPGSKSDAADLADRLGVRFHTVPIESAHRELENMLAPHFEGRRRGVTEENIQARIRGLILMAMSNKFGSLLVTTGNKSELAVGYCTLYGDMCGGLAVLSDVPKTMVWELACWINAASPLGAGRGPVIPAATIEKPPSAELREQQTDQDSLPPYEVLDPIIERHVEQNESVQRIVDQTGFDPEVVQRMVRLIDLNEYKRKQAAPGLKITGRAFGPGRRMPMARGG